MLKAAVLGSPVSHSLSPVLHRAAYAALGLSQWTYDRREVVAGDLAAVVAELDGSWRGLSLTMPLKEAAFDVVATTTEVARDAGAINTLVRRADGQWDGANTDVLGLVRSVEHVDHGGVATLLGSGATARSAALALAQLGVTAVRIAARNTAAIAEVDDLLSRHGITSASVPLDAWAHERTGLVISTLAPAASESAGRALVGSQTKLEGVTLLDVVYADWPTPLARAARAGGADVISGLDMLVHQAAEQVRLFTGQSPSTEVMFAAGRAALAS